jgi:hypothetical protein
VQRLSKGKIEHWYQRPRYFLMFPFERQEKTPQDFHQRKRRFVAEPPPKAQYCDKIQDKEGLIKNLGLSCNSSVKN